MKKTWDALYNCLFDLKEELISLLSDLPKSAAFKNHERRILTYMNKINRQVSEVNKFMDPVDPIEVKQVFDNQDFLEMWQFWKEYMIEQHSIYMKSRMERSALKRLFEISDKDPEKAMKFIKYSSAAGYKQIFPIENTKQPIKNKDYDPDFN